MLKMYILVKDDVPADFVPLVTAHASLACYLQFQELPEVKEWLSGSFRKVVCKVKTGQFNFAKTLPNHLVTTESALEGKEVAISFPPMLEYPPEFRKYSLYKVSK